VNKDKEVEVVDSREEEVALMEKIENLIILCKIRANLNGRMMIKARPSRKLVIFTEEVLVLIEEDVILTLEVVFMVNVSHVVNKGIDPLSVDPLKVGKVTKIFWFKETLRFHLVDLRLEKI
jgi:hypothetical protein